METRNGNGQFLPGHPGAKKKGDVHVIAGEIRGKVATFLNKRADELDGIWEKLKEREKARLFVELVGYLVPKQKEIQIEDLREASASIDWTKLSPNALKEVLSLTTIHNENEHGV